MSKHIQAQFSQETSRNGLMVGKEIICEPRAKASLRKITSGEWSISSSCHREPSISKESRTSCPNVSLTGSFGARSQELRQSNTNNLSISLIPRNPVEQASFPNDMISLADTSVSTLTETSSVDSEASAPSRSKKV